jgi:hypothetical protein
VAGGAAGEVAALPVADGDAVVAVVDGGVVAAVVGPGAAAAGVPVREVAGAAACLAGRLQPVMPAAAAAAAERATVRRERVAIPPAS